MRQIGVFNHKGGVGKSTVSVFMADFASSLRMKGAARLPRILVLDADDQASAGTALVGRAPVAELLRTRRTFGDLLLSLVAGEEVDVAEYVRTRTPPETEGRRVRLAPLDVMVCEQATLLDLDERHYGKVLQLAMRTLPPLLARHYDLVLVDFPARVAARDHTLMALLAACSHVVVPTEVTDLALGPLESRTFGTLDAARALARQFRGARGPECVGILMNKVNRSYRSYRLHHAELERIAAAHGTRVLVNHLPPASALMTATDGTLDFATVREKYDSYYDQVRKATTEVLRTIQGG